MPSIVDSHEAANGTPLGVSNGHTNGGFNTHSNKTEEPTRPDRTPNGVTSCQSKTPYSTAIAIIGVSGRFPGDGTTPRKLWDLLRDGKNALGEVPESRFNAKGFYHPDGGRAGSMNTQGGYFLKQDVDRFDAGFFSITPEEAKGMDPVQRILLELAYEGLENAGLKMDHIADQNMSCFVGACQHDYWDMQAYDMDSSPKYTATGTGPALLSNRISWFFNLKGPSVTIDTACSSSMTALHLASQSIRNGECDSALVGSLGLHLLPNFGVFMSSMSFLSPDNKCHSFDAQANGYARAEGGGFIVLKRLDKAIQDGDTVRAVIRATGINQDGRTMGITQPSAQRQEELIRTTYASASLKFDDTNYFEAHGTGTKVGDPIECSVIGSVFGPTRQHPILVGSVKSNRGHLEGASGIASIIKTIYSLESGLIPPTHGLQKVNPKIRLQDWRIDIPTQTTNWPLGLRRASINSFGYGGANAHCVLDDAYHFFKNHGLAGHHNTRVEEDLTLNGSHDELTSVQNGIPRAINLGQAANGGGSPTRMFTLSSHEQSGVVRLCQRLQSYLDDVEGKVDHEEIFLHRLAYTLSEKRSTLPWKTYCLASSMEDLRQALSAASRRVTRASKQRALTFIFTGQGAQWFAMGRYLSRYTIFQQSLNASNAYLKSFGSSWDLIEELNRSADTSRIDIPEISQPACTALQLAIVDLLTSFNIRPKVVIGHSSGEIAAAYAKGSLDKQAAMKASYFRGLLTSGIPKTGSMAAVGLDPELAKQYITRTTMGKVVVACINSPSNVTLSGDTEGIDEVTKLIQADGIFARKLRVSTAYHSHHMEAIAEEYLRSLEDSCQAKDGLPEVVMYSSVTAKVIEGSQLGAAYWVANLIKPVNFSGAVTAAMQTGALGKRNISTKKGNSGVMIEIGPHAALQGPLKQIMGSLGAQDSSYRYLSVIKRGEDSVQTCLEVVGELQVLGHEVNLSLANGYQDTEVVMSALTDLPPYAWNTSNSFWHESAALAAYKKRDHPRLELLGARDERSTESEPCWRNYLRISEQPWIEHHQFQGTNIYPMAGMIVMAIESMRQIETRQDVSGYHIRDVNIRSALVVPNDQTVETRLQLSPWRTGCHTITSHWTEFQVSSRNESGAWTINCTGLIANSYREEVNAGFVDEEGERRSQLKGLYDSIVQADLPTLDSAAFYTQMDKSGFSLGPAFRGAKRLNILNSSSHFTMEVPDTRKWTPSKFQPPHLIHPAVLDVFVHLLISSTGYGNTIKARVPVSTASLYVSADFDSSEGTEYFGYSSSRNHGQFNMMSDVVAFGNDLAKPMIILQGCQTVPLRGAATDSKTESKASSSSRGHSLGHVPCIPIMAPDVELADASQLETLLRGQVSTLHGESSLISNELSNLTESTDSDIEQGQEKTSSPDNGAGIPQSVNPFLERYVALFAHKHPGLDILEYNTSTEGLLANFLASLPVEAKTTKYVGSYVLVNPLEDMNSIDSVQQKSSNIHSHRFVEGSYDIVVWDKSVEHGDDGIDLEHWRKLLKPWGVLLVVGILGNYTDVISTYHPYETKEPKESPRGNDIDQMLQSAGFTTNINISDSSRAADSPSTFIVAQQTSIVEPPVRQVLIATPQMQSQELSDLITQVEQTLRSLSYDVFTASLSDMPEQPSPYLCLAMLDFDASFLETLNEDLFSKMRSLLLNATGTLWLTVDGVFDAHHKSGLADGLGRTIRAEHPELSFATLGLDPRAPLMTDSNMSIIGRIMGTLSRKSLEESMDSEYISREGIIFVERLVPHPELKTLLDSSRSESRLPAVDIPLRRTGRDLQLCIRDAGLLDTLEYVGETNMSGTLADDHIEIEVKAVGLNFRDVMVAMGQMEDSTLGIECAGVVSQVGDRVRKFKIGDRVFGMHAGCFQTRIRGDPRTFQKTPEHLSNEEAASMMCIYATVVHSLIDVAKLQRGESVLIHSAAGGVGQAAIKLARYLGADIFATVSSEKKKKFLVDEYGINETHVFNSRDHSFAQGILRMTGQTGVDVVLNSLAGEALRKTWLCVAPFGRFIELGKRDILDNTGLEMRPFLRNITFAGLDILAQVTEYPDRFEKIGNQVVELTRKGAIAPFRNLSICSFGDAEKAFRLMQSGSHIGKIVLCPGPDDIIPVVPEGLETSRLPEGSTYILVGGLGGIGQSISRMLSGMGARNLVFLARSGSSRSESQLLIESLQSQGTSATTIACDVADKSQLLAAINEVKQRFPPIKGVIHCAMDLRDSTYSNMSATDWNLSLRPKVRATRNLHEVLPADLEFFVCLSSIAGIIGSRGQGNYNAGNTYQDALMNHRAAAGLAATSINLSLVVGIGVSTERSEVFQLLKDGGLLSMDETDVLSIVKAAVLGRTPTQVTMGLSTGGQLEEMGAPDPYWFADSRFSVIRRLDRKGTTTDGTRGGQDWKGLLAATTSKDEVYELVLAQLQEGVARIIKMDVENMDPRKSLPSLGIDSLVAIEIRTWLLKEFEADLSVFDIVSNDPMTGLAKKVTAKSALLSSAII
ncbi:hypothetical protein JX266_002315 [Neoarthrinium moseri]|nr:hypothetical protein JX266_002315 [Neoarthrinium moseri]